MPIFEPVGLPCTALFEEKPTKIEESKFLVHRLADLFWQRSLKTGDFGTGNTPDRLSESIIQYRTISFVISV
jgi:hypothetical protein